MILIDSIRTQQIHYAIKDFRKSSVGFRRAEFHANLYLSQFNLILLIFSLVKLSSPQHNLIPQRLVDFPHQSQLCFTSELSWRQEGASGWEGQRSSTNAGGGQKWVEDRRTGYNTSPAASGQPNNAVNSACLRHILLWGLPDGFLLWGWWNPSKDPAKLRNVIWIERICPALPQKAITLICSPTTVATRSSSKLHLWFRRE